MVTTSVSYQWASFSKSFKTTLTSIGTSMNPYSHTKTNFKTQFVLEVELTIFHHFEHAQACLTIPTWSDLLNLLLLWMSSRVQKFTFISHLVCEILQFKESCILIGLKIFGYLKKHIFPKHVVFEERRPFVFSYCGKKVYMNRLDFCQYPKNLIFGPFLGLLGAFWPVQTFFSKARIHHFFHFMSL